MSFSEELKKIKQESHLTINQMLKILNNEITPPLPYRTFQDWLNGKRTPVPYMQNAVLKIFNKNE